MRRTLDAKARKQRTEHIRKTYLEVLGRVPRIEETLEHLWGKTSLDQLVQKVKTPASFGVFKASTVPARYGIKPSNFSSSAYSTADIQQALEAIKRVYVKNVVLQVHSAQIESTADILAAIDKLQWLGIRVVLDVHQVNVVEGANFAAKCKTLAKRADALFVHHPRAAQVLGVGTYVPTVVPVLQPVKLPFVGGLCHIGIAHAGKRFDVMSKVAVALDVQLHCYGPRQHDADSLIDRSAKNHVVCHQGVLDDDVAAGLLARHDVALAGRHMPNVPHQLESSASARFFIASGVPAVLDDDPGHEDLKTHAVLVPYEDFDRLVRAVEDILTSTRHRDWVLERQQAYAKQAAPGAVCARMGLT